MQWLRTEKSFIWRFNCLVLVIPSYSEIIEPLRHVSSLKKYSWNWTPDCDSTISILKQRLTNPPVLAYFLMMAKTILTIDASTTSIGACLFQIIGQSKRPIALIHACYF